MQLKTQHLIVLIILVIYLVFPACTTSQSLPTSIPEPIATNTTAPPNTLEPTNTITLLPSATPGQYSLPLPTQVPNLTATYRAEAWKTSQAGQTSKSTRTPGPTGTPRPRPTRTPNLAATEQLNEWNAEVQAYFAKGYLNTTDGAFRKLDDYSYSWAQLGWYHWQPLTHSASDFFMSGHFLWSSAYRSADTSGCGFAFAIQPNGDQYTVFLDRSKVLFVESQDYYSPIGTTRGRGYVNFDNPFDHPVGADFTLIVKGAYAYVLVDGEDVGEYTLAQSKILHGKLGLALLSGTNKGFGTRCEMTNLHAWIPNE